MTLKDNRGGYRNRYYEIWRLDFYRQRANIVIDAETKEMKCVSTGPFELVAGMDVRCRDKSELPGYIKQVFWTNRLSGAYDWYCIPKKIGVENRHTLEDLDRPNNPDSNATA